MFHEGLLSGVQTARDPYEVPKVLISYPSASNLNVQHFVVLAVAEEEQGDGDHQG